MHYFKIILIRNVLVIIKYFKILVIAELVLIRYDVFNMTDFETYVYNDLFYEF